MSRNTSRREFLLTAGGAAAGIGLASVIAVEPVRATPATMQEAIRKVVGPARVNPGRVKLELPPLVENGNTVPLTVKVESPMTAADHVKALHRIRLADTQTVIAVCELSDGSFWSASVNVVVTLAACLEDA